jgi:predicted HD phosphohydrolase
LPADRDEGYQANRDEEYMVCALLHDIGDTLGSYNHADLAAVIVEPFVSEGNHWMVKHHAIFQGYYFLHFLGLDRDRLEKFRGHPHFEDRGILPRVRSGRLRSQFQIDAAPLKA